MKTAKQEVLDGSDQVAVRQAKLQGLRDSGNDPFGANWEQSHVSKQAELLSGEEEIGPEVSLGWAIVAFRLMGKAAFLKLLDREGRIQAYVRRDEIGDEEYAAFKKLDLGDFIECVGLFSHQNWRSYGSGERIPPGFQVLAPITRKMAWAKR